MDENDILSLLQNLVESAPKRPNIQYYMITSFPSYPKHTHQKHSKRRRLTIFKLLRFRHVSRHLLICRYGLRHTRLWPVLFAALNTHRLLHFVKDSIAGMAAGNVEFWGAHLS
jgi:hypothetical protein